MVAFLGQLHEKFKKDDIFTLSAALALYTAFSLAPLVILLISFLSSLHLDLQVQLVMQVEELIGKEAADVLSVIIEKAAERKELHTLGGWIGSLTLFFSASVIFAHLQNSLNKIFESPVVSHKNQHWSAELRHFIAKRLMSFGIVLSFIFISIISLMLSSLLSFVIATEGGLFGEILYIAASLVLFSVLFSAIFKWIPDRTIETRMALGAGLLTGLLFMIGKTLIGLYLGRTAVGSAYGAAGSIIVLLFWVYYSSLIIFLGAEIAALRIHQPAIKIPHAHHVLGIVERIPRWAFIIFTALLLVRLLLPPFALWKVNRMLESKLGTYTGHVRDLDLSLYRGAYQLQGFEIKKRNSTLPPLLTAEEIDLALSWRSLFRKEISGNVSATNLQLRFSHGTPEQTQSGLEEDKTHWQDVLNLIIPIHIENLHLKNSAAYFTERKLKAPFDVKLENIELTARDLRTRAHELSSPFFFSALLQGHAPIKAGGKLDVLSRPPRGRIGIELENLNVASLNRLLLLYIPLDVTKGKFSFYSEISTAASEAKGYFKFFLEDGDIIAASQDFKSGKHFAYELLSAFGNWILKNNKTGKIAAEVPFEYKKSKLNINTSAAFWSAVKNHWKALKPGLNPPQP